MTDDTLPPGDPPVDTMDTTGGPEAGDAGTVTATAQPLPEDWDATEQLNLVPAMIDDEIAGPWLKSTASRVLDLIKADIDSSKDHMDRVANQVRLFAGRRLPKDFPFEDCANVHLPILCEGILKDQGRMMDMILPPSGEFFHVKPTGFGDKERAIVVEEHLNWQTRREQKDWRVSISNTHMQRLTRGSAFRKVYRKASENKNCSEYISAADFIVPYSKKSTDPMMGDVSRKTHRLRLCRHELEAMEDGDYYWDVASLYKGDEFGAGAEPSTTSGNAIVNEQLKVEGVTAKRPDDPDLERVIYECHCWLALPKVAGADFGTRQKPVIIVIDEQTSKVLSLIVREDDDPMDRVRFERETQQVAAKREMQAMAPLVHGIQMAQDPNATEEQVAATVPQPQPIPDPKPVRKVPIECFIHYWCFDNPEGFYGFGLGYLLEGPNEVANSIMNQILDAGTLANTATAIMDRNSRMTRGERDIVPGDVLEVDVTGRSINDMIKMIEWKGPDPSMFTIIQVLKQAATELSQGGSEALSGDKQQGRTATAAKIETSLALSVVAVLVRPFLFSLDYEIKALARLNSVYLDEKTPFEFATADKLGNVKVYQVTRRDYLNDLDIEFTAEARMASTPQRIEEAQTTLEAIMNLAATPMPLLPPPVILGLVYAAVRSLFEAMNRFDLVKLLGPPPSTMMPAMTQPPMPGEPGMTGPPAPGQGDSTAQPLDLPPQGQPMNESEKVQQVIASPPGGGVQ